MLGQEYSRVRPVSSLMLFVEGLESCSILDRHILRAKYDISLGYIPFCEPYSPDLFGLDQVGQNLVNPDLACVFEHIRTENFLRETVDLHVGVVDTTRLKRLDLEDLEDLLSGRVQLVLADTGEDFWQSAFHESKDVHGKFEVTLGDDQIRCLGDTQQSRDLE
jgi:hypothetical protein